PGQRLPGPLRRAQLPLPDPAAGLLRPVRRRLDRRTAGRCVDPFPGDVLRLRLALRHASVARDGGAAGALRRRRRLRGAELTLRARLVSAAAAGLPRPGGAVPEGLTPS